MKGTKGQGSGFRVQGLRYGAGGVDVIFVPIDR